MGEFAINKEKILLALGTVIEPDLKKDLVTLNMIKDVQVGVSQIEFTVVLTTPACPLKEKIKGDCLAAIEKAFGTEVEVKINMTAEVTTTLQGPILPGVKNIIAIASGKGGVGKSTVTSNLAMALQQSGASVGIIDADIFGPSIPVMFDVQELQPMVQQIDGKNLLKPIIQYGIKLMSMGFLTPPDSAVVWRGPMASQALKQFITDVDWGPLDYLLIDLPPGTSDIHLTISQAVPLTGAVIVTTPQTVALADATKAVAMFKQDSINVEILGIIENMAYFTPAELPNNKYYIFGKEGGQKLADKFQTELLGQIPLVQEIREAGDDGRPAALSGQSTTKEAFASLASKLAQIVAIKNAKKHGEMA